MLDKDEARPTEQVNLRCTDEEKAAIEGGGRALRLTTSGVVEYGLAQSCADFGMWFVDDASPRLNPGYAWPYSPKRPERGTARQRIAAYIPTFLHPAVESAAWSLRQSIPLFAIGSALRLIAMARLVNERKLKTAPTRYNAALAGVRVPYGFDEVLRVHR